jgi:hypothetical protein
MSLCADEKPMSQLALIIIILICLNLRPSLKQHDSLTSRVESLYSTEGQCGIGVPVFFSNFSNMQF